MKKKKEKSQYEIAAEQAWTTYQEAVKAVSESAEARYEQGELMAFTAYCEAEAAAWAAYMTPKTEPPKAEDGPATME